MSLHFTVRFHPVPGKAGEIHKKLLRIVEQTHAEKVHLSIQPFASLGEPHGRRPGRRVARLCYEVSGFQFFDSSGREHTATETSFCFLAHLITLLPPQGIKMAVCCFSNRAARGGCGFRLSGCWFVK
jgi:hypothetical protein